MKSYKTIAIIAAMSVVFTMMFGCGRKDGASDDPPEDVVKQVVDDSPEGLIKQMIAVMSDLADQFETIEDEASADAAAAVIERDIAPRMASVVEKLKALEEDIGEDALEELAETFEEEFDQVGERFFGQLMRVAMNEELMTPALEEAMNKFEEIMDDF